MTDSTSAGSSKTRVSDGDLATLIKGFEGLLALRDTEDDNILAALRELRDRRSDEPGVDSRDVLISALTKWADDWAVVRPGEGPLDKGWRFAAEEVKAIVAKSANAQKAAACPKCEAVRKLGLTSCFEHKPSENGPEQR